MPEEDRKPLPGAVPLPYPRHLTLLPIVLDAESRYLVKHAAAFACQPYFGAHLSPANPLTHCIYCGSPGATSESHVIPESLGGSLVLPEGVCRRCNNDINNRIEIPVTDQLLVVRALLGLEGKRGKRPAMPVTARFAGLERVLRLRDTGHLENIAVVFHDLSIPGAAPKNIAFIGSPDAIAAMQARYQERHPGAIWTPIEDESVARGLTFWISLDLSVLFSEEYRRLMAKIGLEAACQHRGLDIGEYSHPQKMAQYALNGAGADSSAADSVRVVTDAQIHAHIGVPFGPHSILTMADRRTQRLTIYVGLFSWLYYEVVVDTNYPVIESWNRLITVHPQHGVVYEPRLRRHLREPRARWRSEATLVDETKRWLVEQLVARFNKVVATPQEPQ